jgi:hypothetical protein
MSSVKTRRLAVKRVPVAKANRQYCYRQEKETTLELCRDLNTPRSMAVWYLLSEDSPESISQLLNLPPVIRRTRALTGRMLNLSRADDRDLRALASAVRALTDLTVRSFADDYLVTEMMGKNPMLNSGIDRVAAATSSFTEAEERCQRTNERFRTLDVGHPLHATLIRMRRVIADVLGHLTVGKLALVEANFGFGPGATSAVSGADVLLSKKYGAELHITPRLYPYRDALIGPVWRAFPGSVFVVNDESRTTTVPKNAKTERIIAIEPHMNIYVQKGIGALIRQRLQRHGVDLNTQSWNQFLASKAQEWSLSTIDLKGASDSVSHRLVRFLLPFRWFELLNAARVDHTTLAGGRVTLQKFSSMGNGYTFELESLIFYAACIACGSHKDLTAVYGDDLIVEEVVSSKLIEVLDYIGFETNTKKTFLKGNFFESCGTDWFEGVDVRPIYLKGSYVDDTQCRFYIPNAIRRYAHRRGLGRGCDIRYKKAWVSAYRRCLTLERRTAIPYGYGDDGLALNWDESAPSRVWCSKYQSWQGRVLPLRPITSLSTVVNGAYVAALHKGAVDMPRSSEYRRGAVCRSDRLRSQVTLGWPDFGPWQ